MRGSDPNAAIYYLARMLKNGEDPLFIARRLVISASEDIGLANPNAMVLANSTFDTVNKLGMPECRIPLANALFDGELDIDEFYKEKKSFGFENLVFEKVNDKIFPAIKLKNKINQF